MDGGRNDGYKDRRVIILAAEVAETRDRNVPSLLLGLEDIINSLVPGSKEAIRIKQDIWTYDLLQVLILILKQDFEKVNGGWETGARLASLLSHCCVGLDPPESHEFFGLCLPDAIENMLMLSRKIQAKYMNIPKEMPDTRKSALESFRSVLDSLTHLFSGHVFLTSNVMRSPWLLQLMITDDVDTTLSVLSLIQNVLRVNSTALSSLDEKILHSLLDEIIYKLSVSLEVEIGGASTRCLLIFCDTYPSLVEDICSRYKGMRPLLSKWTGKGFGRDLKRLLALLEAGSAQRAEIEKFSKAATTIQALFRSFLTRRKLRDAQNAMSKFQKTFRERRQFQERRRDVERQDKELQHQLLLARKRAVRETRQRQLEVLAILPPSEVDKHLQNALDKSALKIQSQWRGYKERKALHQRQKAIQRIRAVICIQRHWRTLVQRRERKGSELPAFQRPSGLTDERRVDIQHQIMEWRENHPSKAKTRQQQQDLHARAQTMVQRHLLMNKVYSKKFQERQALLARLEIDAELIMNAPKLSEVTDIDIGIFTSKSVPVATKARQNHTNKMKALRQPWWKKLGDEYQDDEYEEDQALF